MAVVTFIIALIALVVAILAYQKSGGDNDLREHVTALHSLKEKGANLLEKLEKMIRKEESEEQ